MVSLITQMFSLNYFYLYFVKGYGARISYTGALWFRALHWAIGIIFQFQNKSIEREREREPDGSFERLTYLYNVRFFLFFFFYVKYSCFPRFCVGTEHGSRTCRIHAPRLIATTPCFEPAVVLPHCSVPKYFLDKAPDNLGKALHANIQLYCYLSQPMYLFSD